MNDRDTPILRKILSEMEFLDAVTKNINFEEFKSNEILKGAIAMTIINIGELVRLLSDDVKQEYSYIPFKEMTAIRNVATHGYQTLRMDDIWDTVKNDIPIVYLRLKEIV